MSPRLAFPRAWLLAAALVAACSSSSAPSSAEAPPLPTHEDVRRLSSILDYVAADYPVAVQDGRVIDEGEYKEQLAFLSDAAALAARVPDRGVGATAAIAELARFVDAKAPPAELADKARALRRRLLDAHGVVIAPAAPPARGRGAELYAQACVACHGANGAADGPAARGLDPAPRSFRDPEVMAELSPARAFNAITDGIRGTAMASFGALPASDRWALAFHVFTLRHDEAAVARGADVAARLSRVPDVTVLAGASDGELAERLAATGAADDARLAGVAWLRAVAPYRQDGAPLASAQRLLASALASYRAGDAGAARQAVAQAYLDGFEPQEGALRARDAALVLRLEEQFLLLREGIGSGAKPDEVERQAAVLSAGLDRAAELLGGGGGGRLAFVGSLIVILREGVEAALLIMLLLGLARRTLESSATEAARDARAVHLGWLGAAALGLVTWFASEPLMRLGGARRELMEGIVALVAAAALIATGHFVIARLDARHRVEAMKRKLQDAVASGRRRWALAGLAFLAVYREAFEVVLFLRAIALDAGRATGAVAAGVAAGAVLLVGAVWLLLRLGKRLKPGPLLAWMGTLLCGLAVVLAGKGVRALQEAGVVAIDPVGAPRIDWLGLFPSWQGVLAQVGVLALFFAIAGAAFVRARRDGAPAV